MKILIVSFLSLLMFSLNVQSQSKAPTADVVLKAAYKKAVNEDKKVVLIFYASWCIWCHKMDTAMNDPSVREYFQRTFITEHLSIREDQRRYLENEGAEALYTKYAGSNNQGIPFWVVLDNKGKLLSTSQLKPGVNSGCPATKEEVDFFIQVLKKVSDISPAEIEAVKARFTKNGQ